MNVFFFVLVPIICRYSSTVLIGTYNIILVKYLPICVGVQSKFSSLQISSRHRCCHEKHKTHLFVAVVLFDY